MKFVFWKWGWDLCFFINRWAWSSSYGMWLMRLLKWIFVEKLVHKIEDWISKLVQKIWRVVKLIIVQNFKMNVFFFLKKKTLLLWNNSYKHFLFTFYVIIFCWVMNDMFGGIVKAKLSILAYTFHFLSNIAHIFYFHQIIHIFFTFYQI